MPENDSYHGKRGKGRGRPQSKMNLDWAKFDPELPQHFNALLGPSRVRQKLSLENPLDLKKIDSVGWIQLDGSVVVFINCSLCLILNDQKNST